MSNSMEQQRQEEAQRQEAARQEAQRREEAAQQEEARRQEYFQQSERAADEARRSENQKMEDRRRDQEAKDRAVENDRRAADNAAVAQARASEAQAAALAAQRDRDRDPQEMDRQGPARGEKNFQLETQSRVSDLAERKPTIEEMRSELKALARQQAVERFDRAERDLGAAERVSAKQHQRGSKEMVGSAMNTYAAMQQIRAEDEAAGKPARSSKELAEEVQRQREEREAQRREAEQNRTQQKEREHERTR